MTLDEAKEGFYSKPSNETAAAYITEAIQYFHDEMVTELTPIRAASEVAYWLRYGHVIKFQNE